ncbi:MAG: CRISPR-associated helicase Cas3' [Bacteroidaceae bacterium]|nr:CRISPR-associated helicase Cas3' [Bacteroidaceae bacterium]
MREGENLLSIIPASCKKCYQFVGKELSSRIAFVCKHHDEGKKDAKWQIPCQQDYISFKKWCDRNNMPCEPSSYKKYESAIGYNNIGVNIRKCGIRHEMYSLHSIAGNNNPVLAAIAAHHGKLQYSYEDVWEKNNVNDKIGDLRRFSNNECESNDPNKLSNILKLQYEYSALRSLLQFADHRASAKEEGDYVPPLKTFSYKFPHATMRPVQQLIADNWQKDLLLLRAPTGAGKTDASLLWAQLQIENQRADRLVIAMPTRFTSNALSISVTESLSDTGLYHSSAWFNKFHQDVKKGNIELIKAKKEHELARLLETPVTVCTIDHLLMALTLTREDHHLITFNLANSCLVIDEADFYDEFTQANILVLLKALKEWQVPVLLMSASLPETVLKDYQSIGYDIDEILTDHSDENRYRFEIKDIIDYSNVDELENILELMLSKKCGIIYANTIDKAFEFASWFQNQGFDDIIVYHSRFTEPDKQAKEALLIDALGKEAWQKGKAHGIAIMTQIGEMSINISADIMISDFCPIDRLTQRAGRLCRFNKRQIGELYVVRPHDKEGVIYPAPYGTPPTKGNRTWQACEAYDLTNRAIECKRYNSKELLTLLNEVYNQGTNFSAIAHENAMHLEQYFIYNWLIGSKERTKEDDTSNQFWKSRNIPPQEIVFVCAPENSHFKNWHDFQEYKIEKSIEIPNYMVKNHDGDFYPCLVTIGMYEKENILIMREGVYNPTIGYKGNKSNFL